MKQTGINEDPLQEFLIIPLMACDLAHSNLINPKDDWNHYNDSKITFLNDRWSLTALVNLHFYFTLTFQFSVMVMFIVVSGGVFIYMGRKSLDGRTRHKTFLPTKQSWIHTLVYFKEKQQQRAFAFNSCLAKRQSKHASPIFTKCIYCHLQTGA